MRISIKSFLISVSLLGLVMLRCATDPGASTTVAGGAVFKYPGSFRVVVSPVTDTRTPKVSVAVILQDDNGLTPTSFEEGVSVTWPNAVTFLNCSGATLISSTEYTFYKIFQYAVGCTVGIDGLSASASLTVTKVGVGSSTSSGSGSSGLSSHTVFATTAKYKADTVASLSNADSICAAAGAAGSATSSLSGTWRAIISSSTADAKNRLSLTSTAPIKDSAGTTVVAAASSLWSGTLSNSIGLDQNGSVPIVPAHSWTGTSWNGTYSLASCSDWTSTAPNGTNGLHGATDQTWIGDVALASCNSAFHLYCINSNN